MANDVPVTDTEESLVAKLRLEIENLNTVVDEIRNAMRDISVAFGQDVAKEIKKNTDAPEAHTNKEQATQKKEDQEHMVKLLGGMADGMDKLSGTGISLLKGVFGFIQDIFEQIKKSSPLLQAVEQLFNLAWTLFFMPLGNKLGEMLIPAVIQMMDDVMDIWDAFEGMSLGEMFAHAITEGIKLITNFMTTIGESLAEETGLVGAIGHVLIDVSNFLKEHGESILTKLVQFAGWVVTHLKEIIAAIVAFKVVSTGLQITQILTTAAAAVKADIFGLGAMGVAATGLLTTGASGMIAYGAVNQAMMANGGHVDATPGGTSIIVGEGGEGEWIIPDSKMGSIGGNTYNIQMYSYSDEELSRKVEAIVSNQISDARLRSGF